MAKARAHRFLASQPTAASVVFRSQETMEPMMPGKATAAWPANFARTRPRLCRCFLTHSLSPPLSDGAGVGDGVDPPPPVSARTTVDIAIPIAVRMLAIVMPCSRKSVRMRSASVVSSFRILLNVSRMRLICERKASLFAAAASRREARSSSRLRKRSARCRLENTSSAASSFLFSKAM